MGAEAGALVCIANCLHVVCFRITEKIVTKKIVIMENPFKFGTIVEAEYFTDRVAEVAYICQFVASANHLVMISPRRFGKSSVVAKAVKQTGRDQITLNLQNVMSVPDLAAKLLREFFKLRPLARVRHLLTHFRFIPTISSNPVTGAMEVSFQPGVDGAVLLEDVLRLLEDAYSPQDRLIVVLDEFQEIREMAPKLDRQLRSILQVQKNINYILLGSQESMMTDIFENKKSPFYHFGELMRLGKLPRLEFHQYLSERLAGVFGARSGNLADEILDYTGCHPYYSQQLAANVWQIGVLQSAPADAVPAAIDHIVKSHGLDYERLWMGVNRTNRWILRQLAMGGKLDAGERSTSTIYSAIKRLQKDGYVIYSDHYELEDPFYRKWIVDQQA